MEYFLQQFLNALAFGAEYALVALGLAVVFSIMGLVNFAYGEIIAAAAYAVLLAVAVGLASPLGAIVLALAMGVAASVLLERVAFRPVRKAPLTTGLLTAFGVSIILQNLFQLLISPRPQAMPLLNGLSQTMMIGPYAVSSLQLMQLATAVVAGRRAFKDAGFAGFAVHFINGAADDAACEELPRAGHGQSVDAVKGGGAGDGLHFIFGLALGTARSKQGERGGSHA